MENVPPLELLTVAHFVERYPFISQGGLRYLIYRSQPRCIRGKDLPANAFAPALHRIGRRIYIDPAGLFRIIAAQKLEGVQ